MMGKRRIKMCRALILLLFAVVMALGVLLSATIMPGIRGYAKESSSESVLVKKTLKQIDIKKKDSLYNKVKKIHDWIVFNIEYDHLWLDVDNGETAGYTKAQIEEAKTHQPAKVEWVLNNKLAICAGYSAVFKAMMDELGIECKVISSKSMNHAWNMVKMDDGCWYHIDVTFDDVAFVDASSLGGYNTENFLRSDKGISGNHNGWDKDAPKANGKKYEKNVNHDYKYNRSEKDEYWSNGNIKINYNCNDYSLYTKYSKTGVVTYKKFRFQDGSLGENYYTKKGIISKEKVAFTDGTVVTKSYSKKGIISKENISSADGAVTTKKYSKKGIISSEKIVFSNGIIQKCWYDKEGVITKKKPTFTDGAVGVTTYSNGVINHEVTTHADGAVREIWFNKNGIKLKETFTFKDGGYWYYTYDDNGEMSHKSYFFPDGKEQKEF